MSTSDAGGAGGSGPAGPRGPIAWFAANPVAANLLMAFLIVAGAPGLSSRIIRNSTPGRSSSRSRRPVRLQARSKRTSTAGWRRLSSAFPASAGW